MTGRFEEALCYAARLHNSQQRKGSGVPYIAHLLGVASIALEYGADEDQAIAALLHDAVEDQGGLQQLEEIRQRFGERVASMVKDCSDAWTLIKPPWKKRKLAYLEHLKTVSEDVLLISCADKIHNASSILKDYRQVGETIWNRFKGKKDGTLWYYRALVSAYQERGMGIMVEELDRIISDLEVTISNQ
ncbi:MAG: HD domain-containing protein [Anaerolineaceae bacterium]|nr:HD domain-containing protein [Anaerolineaceae bacterium]